jgi:hypothetical protein
LGSWIRNKTKTGKQIFFVSLQKIIVMELTLNLEYRQVLDIVRQLPANQIEKIKKELTESFIQTKAKSEISKIKKFILSGPVMSDSQYQVFKQQREHFNLWRTA